MSGQRLTAWFLELEGNPSQSAVFSTFHDDQLDSDCSFVPSAASDGFLCMPSASGEIVYLDGACLQPAQRVEAMTTEPPAWLSVPREATQPGCVPASPLPRVAYQRGEQLFAGGFDALGQTLPTVFARSGASCQETPFQTALLPPSLYALEAVDERTFVAARAGERRLTSGFGLRRLVAEDGAEQTLSALDAGGRPCEPELDGLCVPHPFSRLQTDGGPGSYLDSGCSRRAFTMEGGQCSQPKFGLTRTGLDSRVNELAAASTFVKVASIDPVTGGRVLDAQGNVQYSCVADAGATAFAPGADLTATLPRAERIEVQVGELRWVQQRAPGDEPAFIPLEASGALVDDRGLGCRPSGTFDCATEGPEVYQIGLSGDPACEGRLYGVAGADLSDGLISELRRFEAVDNERAQLLSFKLHSGLIYERRDDSCVRSSTAGAFLEVDHAFALPRLTRVAR